MDFSQKVDLRAFTLADPYRVVIDLPQVTFNLPPKTGETGRGLVKAFRFGLVMQGGSRIVMDVGKPVRIDKAFVIDAGGGPAGAAGGRSRRDRPRQLHEDARGGRPAGAGCDGQRRWSARPRTRAIRVRSSCSIPATAASTTARSPRSGEMEKDIVLEFATAASRPARTVRQIPRGDDAHRRHLHSAGRPGPDGAHPAGGAVRLDPCRRDQEGRGRGAGRDDLHAVGNRLRRRGGPARRDREPRRRHRRHRHVARARRCRRHPDRSGAARDQGVLAAFRQDAGRRHEESGPDAQESDEIGGLQGAEGARRAGGADRTRLRVEQGRSEAAHLRAPGRPRRPAPSARRSTISSAPGSPVRPPGGAADDRKASV